MSASILPVVLAGGGVAYLAVKASDGAAPTSAGTRYIAPTGGSTIQQAQKQASGFLTAFGVGGAVTQVGAPMTFKVASAWNYNASQKSADPELQRKLDLIEAEAKKQYENANEVAKAAAADKLNKELKLDPPLNGHETWEVVSATVGGAVGAAGGVALCGPVCGKLGALAGAYLGAKLEDLVSKNWDDLKSWIGDKWGDVKGAASDAWNWFEEQF